MARDYKHRAEMQHREPIAGWKWLAAGVLIGSFAAFLLFLQRTSPVTAPDAKMETLETAAPPAGEKQQEPEAPAAEKEPEPEAPAEPRFEFYTLLPDMEVVVPEAEVKTLKREEHLGKPEPGSYTLQVGSFREFKEADRLKAELALLGIPAVIETADIGSRRWNRVKIGPFDSMTSVDRVRAQLRSHNIDAVVLRTK